MTLPRRILMTGDCVGGVWTYALDLVAALAPYGVEVTLFACGRELTAGHAAEAAAVANLTLVHRPWALEWQGDADADLPKADALLAELAAELRPDVVHVNGFHHAALPFAAPVVCVAHSSVGTWSRAVERGARKPLPEFARYSERLRNGIAAADVLVAPTASFLASFLAEHAVAPNATRVIANGRDPARFGAAVKRPVALSAGRLQDRAKGADTLARAARHTRHDVRLVGMSAPAIFKHGPIPANVVAIGELGSGALADEMARAAVFVAPVRYEPFGLAILEAAFSRCALVLGDIPTLRELWDGAAVFVDPEDDVALAEALDALLGDPAAATALGDAAFERAKPRTAAAMAERYLALYSAVSDARMAA